eukprot:g12120.t1
MVNVYIRPERVTEWANRRRAYAAAHQEFAFDPFSSTDEGESVDLEASAPGLHDAEAAAPAQGSEDDSDSDSDAARDVGGDKREDVLLKACIFQVRRDAPKKATWNKDEVTARAVALRATLRAPWDDNSEVENMENDRKMIAYNKLILQQREAARQARSQQQFQSQPQR